MGWNGVDKLNKEFEKLDIKQRYEYFEDNFGELLGDIWKDWDEDIVEEDIERMKEKNKSSLIKNEQEVKRKVIQMLDDLFNHLHHNRFDELNDEEKDEVESVLMAYRNVIIGLDWDGNKQEYERYKYE